MKVVHLTYSHVKPGHVINALTLREHDPKVDAFLIDHITDLRKRQATGNSPVAKFVDASSAALFDKLRNGTEQDFLTAATALTTRLIAQMNGTTGPGLLVCVRTEDGAESAGAALKLGEQYT